MIFELTDSISKEILFAMENQNSECFFDANKKAVISYDSLEKEIPLTDTEINSKVENIYSLPSWSSNDGYNLLEKFTFNLHSEKIQSELKKVLANGRGVFRNFKNVLKNYPEVYRRFEVFKKKEMQLRLMEWYNTLRESWGLEKLEQDIQSDENDDLLREDFIFRQFDYNQDKNQIDKDSSVIAEELNKQNPGELGQAIAQIWLRQYELWMSNSVNGFVCRTLSNEFAGCLLYSTYPSCAKETVSLSVCFVNQNYRGLGIAKELFTLCFSYLKKRGIHWFIIAGMAIPQILEPMISQLGFEKKGTLFVADLLRD